MSDNMTDQAKAKHERDISPGEGTSLESHKKQKVGLKGDGSGVDKKQTTAPPVAQMISEATNVKTPAGGSKDVPGNVQTENAASKKDGYAEDGLLLDPEERPLILPTSEDALIKFLSDTNKQLISHMAIMLTRKPHLINEGHHRDLRAFLRALKNLQMTPKIKGKTGMEAAMMILYANPRFQGVWPKEIAAYAKGLRDQWEESKWGQGELVDDTESEVDGSAVEPRAVSAASSVLRSAPQNHSIYGIRGIMRGIILRKIKTTSYLFDPQFVGRRDAKVFGHNGLTVGDWWPRQICALRDGAHGVKMGGIAGNILTGAYSILVAAGYEGMDDDQGDKLTYAGSDSHKNEDRKTAIASAYTMCLSRSIATQKPVRVIRSHRGRHICAPARGFRYDGLYKVTKEIQDFNEKGGLYIKFRLVRDKDQPDIVVTRPTEDEIYEESKVEEGY